MRHFYRMKSIRQQRWYFRWQVLSLLFTLPAFCGCDKPVTREAQKSARPHAVQTAKATAVGVSAAWSNSYSLGNTNLYPKRNAAIVLNTEDQLLAQTAEQLAIQFQNRGSFEQVSVFPLNQALPAGELLPDIFITIDRGPRSVETNNNQSTTQCEAEFKLSVGNQIARSSHSWQETLSPPVSNFRLLGDMKITIDMTGVSSWDELLKSIGTQQWDRHVPQTLAEKLAEECDKQIQAHVKKHESLQAERVLPAEFFPEYEPVPDWPWLKEFHAVKLVDGRRFMVSNHTVWKIPKPVDEQKLIECFKEHFPKENQADTPGSKQNARFFHRTNYGETALEVFSERDGFWTSSDQDEPQNYYVVWTHRIGQKEIGEALNRLLERNPSEQELATVSFCWFLNWEGVNRYFAQHPPKLFLSMENLANSKSRPDRKELILKANSLALIQTHPPHLGRLESNAKDIGMEKLPKTPDLSLLVPDHLLDLTAEVVPEVTLQGDVPQQFYAGEGEDRTHIFQIRSLPQTNQQERVQWERTQIDLLKNGRTTSTTTGAWETCPVTLSVVGQRGFREMRVKQTDSPKQYTLTFGPIQMHSTEIATPPPSSSDHQTSDNQSSEEK
ncbi:MAG TPA: hypothetical protein VNQ76_00920 [Planctomicrobium sp.]|nr:hypothetical protein [Planctomicrobium sp.]